MKRASYPRHGWVGLVLLVIGQTFTQAPLPPWSEYWYGLCWTGFVLAVDAWVHRATARSLLVDRRADVVFMAAASASLWWGFEAANVALLQSWSYSASPDTPTWLQRVRSTWFFATLMPVTWVAMVAALSMPWAREPLRGRPVRVTPRARAAIVVVGVVCALAAVLIPVLSLPLVLVAVVAVLDPMNHLRGRPSLLGALSTGDLRVPVALVASSFATGLLGEYWNYRASPKWTYDVPWIGFAYVFEMPLLGYLGYPLLAMVLFVTYHTVRGMLPRASRGVTDVGPIELTGLR